MKKIAVVFGTRPEAIKLAPVIQRLTQLEDRFRVVNILSGQHQDLVQPILALFAIPVDHDLRVMVPKQSLNELGGRLLGALDPVLAAEAPDLVLVQGDTTTALMGALAAFHRFIPVGHVEAGLRTGDAFNPYPEELYRRLISRIATYHFAATSANRKTLIREGTPPDFVFVTGNPVVDALNIILHKGQPGHVVAEVLEATEGLRRVLVTTHRREAFGGPLAVRLATLRRFAERHDDIALIVSVHPNPCVREPVARILSGHPRIHLIEPADYAGFIALLRSAWLIASDSGGIQEEAASIGKPLLVLRENTERPEAVESGYARLAGDEKSLAALLEQAYAGADWMRERKIENPFGRGDSAERISTVLAERLSA